MRLPLLPRRGRARSLVMLSAPALAAICLNVIGSLALNRDAGEGLEPPTRG